MKPRNVRIVLVALLTAMLALPAWAGDSATQEVDVNVLPAGVLAIYVEENIQLGLGLAGQDTDTREFWMGILNTTSDGWEVKVQATDFANFDWDCDEFGDCSRVPPPAGMEYTIPAGSLYIDSGYVDVWGDPAAVTPHAGYLPGADTEMLLMEGTPTAFGDFGIDNPWPSMFLSVPLGTQPYNYTTTVTYTIYPVVSP